MTRADKLRAFLKRFHNKPIVWGQDDCSAAPALWASEISGRPVPLPRYSDHDGAHRLIQRAGGLAELWTDVLSPAGFYESHGVPKLGDIGVIDTRLHGAIGCIFMEGGIAALRIHDEAGIGSWKTFAPRLRHVRFWAVPGE